MAYFVLASWFLEVLSSPRREPLKSQIVAGGWCCEIHRGRVAKGASKSWVLGITCFFSSGFTNFSLFIIVF